MVEWITRAELVGLIETDSVQLVDVLPEREFLESHIPGAVNVPLKTLNAETVSLLSRDKPVVVY